MLKPDPNDNLKNRRLFFVVSFVLIATWPFYILHTHLKHDLDPQVISDLLKYWSLMGGAGLIPYILGTIKK